MMEFTYDEYRRLLLKLSEYGYKDCLYDECQNVSGKKVVLRHDIDVSLDEAVRFSEIEKEVGVKATYFVLISTDFYNVASKREREFVKTIQKNGGAIGLHFDEVIYKNVDIIESVQKEALILEKIIESPVKVVSMHRPSQQTLGADYHFEGIINSYSKIFFKDFKYVSDSRRNWKEDIHKIIECGKYDKLHILTHPVWYNDIESSAGDVLKQLIRDEELKICKALQDNIRDVEELINFENIHKEID